MCCTSNIGRGGKKLCHDPSGCIHMYLYTLNTSVTLDKYTRVVMSSYNNYYGIIAYEIAMLR